MQVTNSCYELIWLFISLLSVYRYWGLHSPSFNEERKYKQLRHLTIFCINLFIESINALQGHFKSLVSLGFFRPCKSRGLYNFLCTAYVFKTFYQLIICHLLYTLQIVIMLHTHLNRFIKIVSLLQHTARLNRVKNLQLILYTVFKFSRLNNKSTYESLYNFRSKSSILVYSC